MKLVVSHITGNANVKAALNGFQQAGMLSAFYVSLATFQQNVLGKMAGLKGFSELRRRQFHEELAPLTKFWPWREAGRVLLPKLGLSSMVDKKGAPFHIDSVCQNFDRHVAAQLHILSSAGVNGMYAYEDIAEFSFAQAKKLGMECLYDLPIGYWKAANHLMAEQKEKWPQYFETITGFEQSEEKLRRKEVELQMADRIFVASTFTAETLKYNTNSIAPVHVVPYGFPPVTTKPRNHTYGAPGKKLKLLFVGSLSQRKGIAELFTAVEKLKDHVELTVIGTRVKEDCKAVNVELAKHTWIPSLPHHEILEQMRAHDVLIFPSLFEGFGLVITEAMSQGTPVITTDRTAGPDIIDDGTNGWLINAGSTEALIKSIENILTSPGILPEVSHEAKKPLCSDPGNSMALSLHLLLTAKKFWLTKHNIQLKLKKEVIFINSHPIQYFAPLYKYLNQNGVPTSAWYCTDETIKGSVDKEFGVEVKWDIPLLEGYNYKFFKNYSPRPSHEKGYFRFDERGNDFQTF